MLARLSFNWARYIGPGILMAGAAIGVSHLVQSTRAGADFGWQLIALVLLANILKYPFFEFGHRYAAATGESLLHGYLRMGRGYIWLYLGLNVITAIGSVAAVGYVSAAIAASMLPMVTDSVGIWMAIIFAICITIYAIGHYELIDKTCKLLMGVLVIATITAFIGALFYDPPISTYTPIPVSPWSLSALPFLIALMGWMPGPIEMSSWQSLWIQAKNRVQQRETPLKVALIDFHIGYGLCVVLAVLFLGLGAMMMHHGNVSFSNSAATFAGQIIELYTAALGEWARPVIALAAFMAMFSTTFTLLDAYPRSLSLAMKLCIPMLPFRIQNWHWMWVGICAILALVIGSLLTQNLKQLVDVVTIIAFLAAPAFAWLNMRLLHSNHTPAVAQPKRWLTILSWVGLIYLISFGVLYLVSLLLL